MLGDGIIVSLIKVSRLGSAFHKVFIKRWGTKGDPNMLLLQLSEMKKKENETVKEFDTRFERLLQQIPDNISPKDDVILFLYVNAYVGQFGFMLKDKFQRVLKRPKSKHLRLKQIFFPPKLSLLCP
jgi:hypothetical protein